MFYHSASLAMKSIWFYKMRLMFSSWLEGSSLRTGPPTTFFGFEINIQHHVLDENSEKNL